MSPLSKKNHSSQAGFSTLVLVFYLLFIFISLAGAMASVVLVSKRQYATNLGARKAYYGAESYINRTLFKVMVGGDWPSDGEIGIGADRIVIRTVPDESITISHISPRAKRTLEVSKTTEKIEVTKNRSILLILDCSGTMSDKVNGDKRMKKAKEAIITFFESLRAEEEFDEDNNIGLMTFEVDQLYYQNPYLVPASDDNINGLIARVNGFSNDPDSQEEQADGYCRGYHDHGFTNTAGTVFYATKTHKDLDPTENFVSFNIVVTDGIPSGVWLPAVEVGSCQENSKEKSDEKAINKLNCLSDNILPNYSTRHFVVVIDKNAPSGEADNAFKKLVKVGGYDESGYVFSADALDLAEVLSKIKDEIIKETFLLHEVEPEAD